MPVPETICINTTAFYALIDEVIAHVDQKFNLPKEAQWIDGAVVMQMLGITSRTTLGTIKDSGKLKISVMSKKVVLYDRQSVLDYIEAHAKKQF